MHLVPNDTLRGERARPELALQHSLLLMRPISLLILFALYAGGAPDQADQD